MRHFCNRLALLCAALFVVPLVSHAQQSPTASATMEVGPGSALITETVEVSAIIVDIEAAERLVVLRIQDGREFAVVAGPEVRNFAQLRLGDEVVALYVQALSIELRKAGAGTSQSGASAAVLKAPEGGKPGAAIGTRVTLVADVTGVQTDMQTVTLRGPKGRSIDVQVRDQAQFSLVAVGDKVELTYAEAMAVSVEPRR